MLRSGAGSTQHSAVLLQNGKQLAGFHSKLPQCTPTGYVRRVDSDALQPISTEDSAHAVPVRIQ